MVQVQGPGLGLGLRVHRFQFGGLGFTVLGL